MDRLRQAGPGFEARAPLVAAAAGAAGLGVYRTVALVLKLYVTDRPPSPSNLEAALDRPAWQRVLHALQPPLRACIVHLPVAELELLMLEQYALACERLSPPQLADLAARHEQERALLADAGAAERAAFIGDKRSWLLDEIQLDELHALAEQLMEELELTRMQYLKIAGRAVVELVEAANRVALLRYRVALDDPTLTPEELRQRLRQDLHAQGPGGMLVHIEPELRQALLDSEQGVQADYDLVQYFSSLHSEGRLKPASDEERREAKRAHRELARLIHPDKLAHHPQFQDMAPQNQARLKEILQMAQERLDEIWRNASGTDGVQLHLSKDRVLDTLARLREWKEEVLRILRALSLPIPSLLLHGDTLEARQADLRRAMADVQCHLHAVRDDIAALEFDPLHGEYRRVIALGEEARAAERERMVALAEAWNAEARDLAAQLLAKHAEAARDAPQQPREQHE